MTVERSRPRLRGFSDLGDDGSPESAFGFLGWDVGDPGDLPTRLRFAFPITGSPDHPILSFAFLRVLCGELLVSRSRAIPAMSAIGALARATPLCLRPSARYPPPIAPLLKTKAKVQFDWTVTERSKPLFCVFQRSNQAQFQPCFSVFTVRSAEGRKLVASG